MSEFSAELEGHSEETHFGAVYRGQPPSRIVAESDQFVVLVDVAPLVEGHILVIPRVEVPSFAALSGEAAAEWPSLKSKLSQRLTDLWSPPTVFEHGSSPDMVGSACITHAHLHLIPGDLRLDDALRDDELVVHRVAGHEEISGAIGPGRPYFYVEDPHGSSVVAAADHPRRPNQYLRRLAAHALGLPPDRFDWNVHVDRSLLRETLERLQG